MNNSLPRPQRRQFLARTTAAASVILFGQADAQAGDNSLRLYSWPDYLGSVALEDFSTLTGISVSADFYKDSDEVLSTIGNSDNQYDIVIASYDYIEEMIGADLLMPLDHSQIPNTANLFPVFSDASFDPGRQYSIPFVWGTQGICYRKSAVDSAPRSWDILLNSDAHSGRMALPGPDTLGLALKYLGYSYNSVNPTELEAAGELVIRQKPHVKPFSGAEGIELLANGEVDVTVGWSSEILGLMEDDDDIDYRVPDEGSLLWQDCLCIPNSSTNSSGAHTLINHTLDANVSAAIADYLWYATPNQAALELMPREYREDHVVFPGMDIIERCEAALNLGEEGTRLRDETWQKVLES